MPSKSEKQRRFFGAVLNCKENGVCSNDKIKQTADNMSINQIKDFLTNVNEQILIDEFEEYGKKYLEETELTEKNDVTKKYGRNRLFSTAAMKKLVEENGFLTNQYERLNQRGKEIFSYHYNEIILSFIFLKSVIKNNQLYKRYLQIRNKG